MSATLGGLIKDYRLQKNISQIEVAFALGWKEPSRLSRIEQGKVGKPKRDLIEKICFALELDRQQRNTILNAGNYLPTAEELDELKKKVDPFLQRWKYPAILYDFTWRLIHANEAAHRVYNLEEVIQIVSNGKRQYVHMLEIIFHPEYIEHKQTNPTRHEKYISFLQQTLTQFKTVSSRFSKEKWYTTLMTKMMGNDLFKELWLKPYEDKLSFEFVSFLSHETDVHPENRDKSLEFNIFNVSLLKDPRFDIEFHNPSNIETLRYFSI